MLKKYINVQWNISSQGMNKFGTIRLNNIHLSDKMIENLELLPTTWNVTINDTHVDSLVDNVIFPVGKAIKIKAILESGFEYPFKGQICIEFYDQK